MDSLLNNVSSTSNRSKTEQIMTNPNKIIIMIIIIIIIIIIIMMKLYC